MNDAETFIAFYRARKSFSFVDLFLKKIRAVFIFILPHFSSLASSSEDRRRRQSTFSPPPFSAAAVTPELWPRFPPSCPNITQRRREERKGGKWKWSRRKNLVLLLRPDVQVLTFSDQLEREAKFPTFSFQDVQLEQESFFVLSRLARKKCHVMESKFGESCTRTTPLLQNSIFLFRGWRWEGEWRRRRNTSLRIKGPPPPIHKAQRRITFDFSGSGHRDKIDERS